MKTKKKHTLLINYRYYKTRSPPCIYASIILMSSIVSAVKANSPFATTVIEKLQLNPQNHNYQYNIDNE